MYCIVRYVQLHCIVYSVLGTPYEKCFKNTIRYFSVYVLLDMGLEMTKHSYITFIT